MTTKLATVLATASIIALVAPAFAQDAGPAATVTPPAAGTPQSGSTDTTAQPDNSAAGDIVVTAQRRAERVTEVPISITVANQAQLERQQVNTVTDLSRIAPSLEIQAAPGQNTGGGGYIRGIGTQTFGAGSTASVGIVVDQVSEGNANIGDLFDVARVEVLKGPQGTLFGLTTSAGVINITTNAPDPSQFSARIRTELSGAGDVGSKFGDQIVQGVVNVPVSSDAALRISGVGNFRQGPDRNADNGHYSDTNHYGGRARFLWKPTSDLTVNLIGDYTKTSAEDGGDFLTFIKAGGPNDSVFGQIPDVPGITARLASCGVTVGEGNRTFCTTQHFTERNTNYGASGQIDYDAGPFTLTNITSYRENRDRGGGAATDVFRADPLILQVANGDLHRNLSLFTEEFRVSSPSNSILEYTVGAFFSSQVETRQPESLTITLQPMPGVVVPGGPPNLGAYEDISDQSLAVFGQGTLHVTPKLRLIAGGRYTSERLNLDYTAASDGSFTNEHINPERVSWRFGAQYDVARGTMVYATASKGYKGGQIAIPSLPELPYVVTPEIPTAYEAGVKSTLFGGWIMDLNAFYEKIQGFQAQQCTEPAGVISCFVTNINGVKTRGAEINFFGRVFQGLSLNTGFIMAKATYPKGFLGSDGTDIGNTQLAYAPKYKFTLSGEYEHELTSNLKGFLAADTVWKSRIRYEQNALADSTFHPHWLVGSRIGVRTANDRYSAAVFGRNLFNVHEPILLQSNFPYENGANIGAIYGPQSFRELGLQLEAKF